ncbi:MAG: PEGA domain-containing protein, partial [Bacteroidota bacterium]
MKQFMYFMFLGGLLVCSSCASLINPAYQPVEVKTKSKDSKVYIDGKFIGEGKTVKTKISRDADGKKVVIVREGYKNSYKTFTPEKKSPWTIMSVVPGLVVLAPFFDYGAKAFNYNKSVSAGTTVGIVKRADNQRYLILESAGMEIEQKGFRVVFGKKNGPLRPTESNSDRLKVDNTIFSLYIDSLLVRNDFRETTDKMLVNPSAHLFLNMEISKLYIFDEYRKTMPGRHYTPIYTFVKPEITWELSNIYGDVLFSKKMKVKS